MKKWSFSIFLCLLAVVLILSGQATVHAAEGDTRHCEGCQADIAASFQKSVTDVLVANAMHAVEEYQVDKFAIAGGVASNSALREAMRAACEEKGVKFYYPSPVYCTDNAAMIGVAAYYEYMNGTRHGWDLNAVPNLRLGER